MVRCASGTLSLVARGSLATVTLQFASRRCPNPAGLRNVEHDAVRTAILHLDVRAMVVADAEGLLDVVPALRAGRGELVEDGLEALDLEADVMDAAEASAALDAGRLIVLEVQDGQVDVAVAQKAAARARI